MTLALTCAKLRQTMPNDAYQHSVTTSSDDYLTLEEVAQLTRTTIHSVRRWIKVGKLRKFKPGRHPLVLRSDLEALLESTTRAGPPPKDEAAPNARAVASQARNRVRGRFSTTTGNAKKQPRSEGSSGSRPSQPYQPASTNRKNRNRRQ